MDKAEEKWFERAYDKYVDEVYNDDGVEMTREEFRAMWDEVKDGFEFEKDSGNLADILKHSTSLGTDYANKMNIGDLLAIRNARRAWESYFATLKERPNRASAQKAFYEAYDSIRVIGKSR